MTSSSLQEGEQGTLKQALRPGERDQRERRGEGDGRWGTEEEQQDEQETELSLYKGVEKLWQSRGEGQPGGGGGVEEEGCVCGCRGKGVKGELVSMRKSGGTSMVWRRERSSNRKKQEEEKGSDSLQAAALKHQRGRAVFQMHQTTWSEAGWSKHCLQLLKGGKGEACVKKHSNRKCTIAEGQGGGGLRQERSLQAVFKHLNET
jgi:hypothetical protein